MGVSDENNKIARKSYHEKLSNTEFVWDRNSLSQADSVSDIPLVIDKYMVRESISNMKNEKAAGPSGIMLQIIKAAREAGVDMSTNQIMQIIVEVVPTKWELSIM